MFVGGIDDFAQRRGSDASRRIVDDAFEGFFVVRIGNQTEISYNVLNLFALVERLPPIDAIGYHPFAQRLFENAALGIGTVKDGEVRPGALSAAVQLIDFVGHNLPLFHIAVSPKDAQCVASFFFRKDFFPNLILVFGYQAIGRLDNGLRRTVVLFQLKDARAGKSFGEGQDVVNVRPTERVDALRVVAHHADVPVLGSQLKHDAVLGKVGVLILVHKDVFEMLAVLGQHLRMVAEKQESIEQQVVEVHRIRLAATLPIALVDIAHGRHPSRLVSLESLAAVCVESGRDQMVFRVRDACLHHARLVHLIVQFHLFQDVAYQALGIGRVVDGKSRRETQLVSLGMQDAQEHGMERAHPQPPGTFDAYLAGNAFLHLTSGLVGECQRQDVPRLITILQQIGNLVSQHPRLPRTRPGYHQQRPVVVEHSGTLAVVQLIDVIGHILVWV